MPCYHPLAAWQTDAGDIVFVERGKIRRALDLPCGQCIGCRLERSRQWAVRCVHESQMHADNSFITLTYADEHVPDDFSLNYRHFQLFAKRLRKRLGPFRFYMCGEYGDKFGRPHFHACLFGLRFSDAIFYSEKEGIRLYTSKILDEIWGKGGCTIGDVSFESAAYVARYVTKKVTGPRAAKHYEAVDPYTGEIYNRTPEFTRMSLKPGIGATWFAKYRREVYPNDFVVMRGRMMKPPKSYDRLLAVEFPYHAEDLAFARYEKALKFAADSTIERLAVREKVAMGRFELGKRKLE